MQLSMSFMSTQPEALELWHQLDLDGRKALIRSLARIIAKMAEPTLEEERKRVPDDR